MPHQESLTVMDQIKPGKIDLLKDLLGTISGHRDSWDIISFKQLSNVHFARLVVFDEAKDLNGNVVPPSLAMMTNVDAPMKAHLHDLAKVCGKGIDRVFAHCLDYPVSENRSFESRLSYLQRHMVSTRAFYVNRYGRSVQQIKQEDELRKSIDSFLDTQQHSANGSMEIRTAIQEFVKSRSELSWALSPAEPPKLWWRIKEILHQVLAIAIVLFLSPILLLSFPIWLILLRKHEKSDVPDESFASLDARRAFRADEDYGGQNQIIAVGFFKPGWFRKLTSNVVLGLTDYAVRHIYNRGSLSGLNTIHFARWVSMNNNQGMFFASNYDGSLESYMNDFIDKAAFGLNAIFSNGDGFPKTAFLFCGGIMDEQAYKRFLPTRQVQSRVWYSAYKGLSTKNIANNSEIRKGLFAPLSRDQTETWLRRFGVGNQLPRSGWVARFIGSIRWERICRNCR